MTAITGKAVLGGFWRWRAALGAGIVVLHTLFNVDACFGSQKAIAMLRYIYRPYYQTRVSWVGPLRAVDLEGLRIGFS